MTDAQTILVAVATLAVSAAALVVALAVYLIEGVRRQVTPNWTPSRKKSSSVTESSGSRMDYDSIRNLGSIYAVGEGTMEGAVLDVAHGYMKPVEFP